ncbi:ABC-F family ATP-binding cassette domain-containing protein [Candidatus Mycoplasma mahonii]|uniref:ABC-F family ATP-binding cassette domain-containing protein n=1 Tax=Candidatus Mycoplasma mahonii TaxID=3004105 RepID=UPI0026E9BFF6|nr:ABC-F family ATP-binding cassette domain-containing protein [Candidatus Mycoplasma mahonii]WKX02368.1 ABC-F family ATP-binding cassette domain-containing protein [Candidatus Mycoplasma mahonii]
MIDIIGLGKAFSDKKLFINVNLTFLKGNTYGIIGANGAGKSTFLKIISGDIESSEGQVIISKNTRLSSLSQDQNLFDDKVVTNAVVMGNKDLYAIQEKKNTIYENPEATEDDYNEAAHLEEEFGAKGGWNSENDAQILLSGLGIEKKLWDAKMSDLKATDKVKVLLAQALFGEPDILIMDEPSNHLDLKAIKWLEEFLVDYANLVIVVSHDSDFLDQICTHIVDIDFGGAKMFRGNYSFWKESSQLALELQSKQNAKKEDQIKQLEDFVRRFSANASKSSQATSRKKALDKITLDDIKPSTRKYPYIRWNLNREPGKDMVAVRNLSYKTPQGETLFDNLNFIIHKSEKVVLIGEDDLAKTKLLEIMNGDVKPTSGEVVWGSTITHDFYPNDNSAYFKTDKPIMDWISEFPLNNKEEENKDNSDSRMRSFLGRMLFKGDSALKNSKMTSGGEKARLMFSKMMLTESNFLLLDQPLDHLDTESIDSVIDGIKEYKSACIFTTYNRALIREAANVIIEIKSNSSFIFRGTLKEYEDKMGY